MYILYVFTGLKVLVFYGLGTEILGVPSEFGTRILMGMLQLHVGVGGGGVQIPGELYPEAGRRA